MSLQDQFKTTFYKLKLSVGGNISRLIEIGTTDSRIKQYAIELRELAETINKLIRRQKIILDVKAEFNRAWVEYLTDWMKPVFFITTGRGPIWQPDKKRPDYSEFCSNWNDADAEEISPGFDPVIHSGGTAINKLLKLNIEHLQSLEDELLEITEPGHDGSYVDNVLCRAEAISLGLGALEFYQHEIGLRTL